MGLLSSAFDFCYGTSRVETSFELLNPNEPVLVSTACKARSPAGQSLGTGWTFSRRAVLLATSQRLICGDWEMPVAEVERATCNSFNGITSRGSLLTVWMQDGSSYQFGLNKSEEWLKALPIDIEAGESFGPNAAVVWLVRAGLAALLLSELL